MTITGKVSRHKPFIGSVTINVSPDKRMLYREPVERLRPDKEYVIRIDDKPSAKSQAQNKYFHKLCEIYGEYIDQPKSRVKYYFKLNYGIVLDSYMLDGKPCVELKSIADYTQKQMGELIDKVVAHMIEADLSAEIEAHSREYRGIVG